jgi:hypothetical protein
VLSSFARGSITSRITAFAAAGLLLGASPVAAAAAPSGSVEAGYANHATVSFTLSATDLGQSLRHSGAVAARASDLYLAIYPVAADGFDASPKLINGWYAPQCNPCFHFGVPDPFGIQFHDHILGGAPGLGADTAGGFSPARRVWLVFYDMGYIAAHSATWAPVTSAGDIAAAVAAGEFTGQPIDTGVIVLSPVNSAGGN